MRQTKISFFCNGSGGDLDVPLFRLLPHCIFQLRPLSGRFLTFYFKTQLVLIQLPFDTCTTSSFEYFGACCDAFWQTLAKESRLPRCFCFSPVSPPPPPPQPVLFSSFRLFAPPNPRAYSLPFPPYNPLSYPPSLDGVLSSFDSRRRTFSPPPLLL